MTGCNPELSFHTQKINTEVLECSHTHVSARSTSTQEVNENDTMSDGCRVAREIMVSSSSCHGCHSLFAVTDLIPCCCSSVECLIMALLIMHCHWWHYRCPLEWILTHRDTSNCLWIDANDMVPKGLVVVRVTAGACWSFSADRFK